MDTRSTSKYDVLEAASCNFADMFQFGTPENSEDKENSENPKPSRFSSMKKSSNLYFSKSSFFLPKPATPLSKKESSNLENRAMSSPIGKKSGESPKIVKRRSSNVRRSMPSDTVVTSEMLNLVCMTVDAKDSLTQKCLPKTLCHQCRIVSGDMKTICRTSGCQQGSFCGHCLQIWYGENARTALKDKSWKCLSCRNQCLCSSCREKQGLDPLPKAIASKALVLGFQSVKDYLPSIKQ